MYILFTITKLFHRRLSLHPPSGMSLRFVQLLQVCEHLVVPIAQALEHFAKKFEVKAITSEVVRCVSYSRCALSGRCMLRASTYVQAFDIP